MRALLPNEAAVLAQVVARENVPDEERFRHSFEDTQIVLALIERGVVRPSFTRDLRCIALPTDLGKLALRVHAIARGGLP